MADDPWAEFRVKAPAAVADPWAEFRVSASRTAPPTQMQALGAGVKQGIPFHDEIAGLRAANPVKSSITTPFSPLIEAAVGGGRILAEKVAPSIFGDGGGKAYDKTVDTERAELKAAQTAHPMTTFAGEVGGSVASGLPAAALIKGATLLPRLVKSVFVGAGLGGVAGAGSGENPEERLTGAYKGAGIGAVAGAGGELAATTIGGLLRGAFGARKAAAPGVDPMARVADADEFGIKLLRGQATGDLKQQAYEEAARNNARGGPAATRIQAFDLGQSEAVSAAKSGILGGEPVAAREAGEAVQEAVKARAASLRGSAEDAYGRAAGKEASIAADEVSRLGKSVAERLEAGGIQLDTYGNYTGSQAAMNLMRRVAGFEGAPSDGKVVAQSLQGLEQARKGLLQVKPANAEDARALKHIRSAFDDWVDDAVDRKLFSGDASALADLKEARGFWAQYKGLTKAKPNDDASGVIVKMQRDGITGEEVANWLTGTAGAGQAGRSARVATELKGILGPSSPEWEALRQAAWAKAGNPARGNGPQAVSKSIIEFTDGQGSPLARALYSSQELGQMRRLAGVIRHTVTDPKAANPSKSGYEVARMLGANGAPMGIGGLAAAFSGDPKYLAIGALPLLKGAQSLSRGIAATKALPSQMGVGGAAMRLPALVAPGIAQDQF